MTKPIHTLKTVEEYFRAWIENHFKNLSCKLSLQVEVKDRTLDLAFDTLQEYTNCNEGSATSISSMLTDGLQRYTVNLKGKGVYRLVALDDRGYRLACEEFVLDLGADNANATILPASCDRCHKLIDGIELRQVDPNHTTAVVLHNEGLLDILRAVVSIPTQELVQSILEI